MIAPKNTLPSMKKFLDSKQYDSTSSIREFDVRAQTTTNVKTNIDLHYVDRICLVLPAASCTGSSFIGAPNYIVDSVMNQTDASYSPEDGIYTVACSTMMTQPNLEFSILGVEYYIPSKEYIIDLELGDGL
ncbi:Inositol hexakisphosphate and diphosphoinositol-pentakisphosphate kinase [Parelaphostrongylus tenuis]|uniref:Inositol hexakisphosphate and diphosphoinositol-pentakisphosphate kinase n=1 Tax=Parelaphostrongylus tenuis TaxID=148309 RepID=A0AAD5QPC3_PARTN|nr:Inositol hexakisphosphate and diphosphoinositol-pentakisphosphate kinase [Parelaphostrongylus tenuis]